MFGDKTAGKRGVRRGLSCFRSQSGVSEYLLAADGAGMLISLGDTYFEQQRYDVAEEIYRTALSTSKRAALPPVDLAIALKALSATKRLQGNWQRGSELATQAEMLLTEERERLELLLKQPPLSAGRQFILGYRKGTQVTMNHLLYLVLLLMYFTTAFCLVQSGASPASSSFIGCGRGILFRHERLE